MSDLLATIAGHSDGMLFATETIRAEQARVDDLVTLIDQYGDVAEHANTVRFAQLVGQTLGEQTRGTSPAPRRRPLPPTGRRLKTARVGVAARRLPSDGTRRQEWVHLAAEVAVFLDPYKVDPAQTLAIPEAYRERIVGAELAARVTALQEKARAQSTPPITSETGRQKPTTALDAMRAANRATADRQVEAQHAAGLTVKDRQVTRGDQNPQSDDQITRDDGRER